MEGSKDNAKDIEELQFLEQHLHNFLAQKQMLQVDLQETSNALEELNKTEDDIYRILSGIMLKANKETLAKELEEKNRLLEIRISSIEKQEKLLEDKAKKLREKITNSMNKEKK